MRRTAPSPRAWQALVLNHPLLYLRVRWADFVAVLTTPDSDVCHFATSGVVGPPQLLRQLGLSARNRTQDRALKNYARLFFATPAILPHRLGASGASCC